MSPQDEDSSSASSCSSEELSDMLDDLEIESNMWASFRESMQSKGRMSSSELGHEVSLSGTFTLADKGNDEEEDVEDKQVEAKQESKESKDTATNLNDRVFERRDQNWAKRLRRGEVYSHRYKPSADERQELKELEQSLGINNQGKGFFNAILNKQENNNGAAQAALWNQIVNSENVDKKLAQSIILKRSPCLWRQSHGKEEPPEEDTSKEVECEAILLTNGLILATVLGSTKKSNAIRLQFERAILWSQVSYVQPYPSADKPTEWQLFLDDNVVWTFACASAKQQDYWLRALERVLVEYHMHTGRTSGLGWQYRFIHKPAFSMAVDPDRMDAVRPPAAALSKLDRYNGYTPLHYAVTLYNETAVKCLLKIGADPNQPDKEEGVTPTDLAVRDEKTPPAILELLTSRGGEIHENMKTGRGALFGQVAAVEEKKEKERRELQQKKEAESAQQQMNENMRLLQQRGEQINEMGSKATELNQGAQDFGSLATKLKEKSKKQNSWMPF